MCATLSSESNYNNREHMCDRQRKRKSDRERGRSVCERERERERLQAASTSCLMTFLRLTAKRVPFLQIQRERERARGRERERVAYDICLFASFTLFLLLPLLLPLRNWSAAKYATFLRAAKGLLMMPLTSEAKAKSQPAKLLGKKYTHRGLEREGEA